MLSKARNPKTGKGNEEIVSSCGIRKSASSIFATGGSGVKEFFRWAPESCQRRGEKAFCFCTWRFGLLLFTKKLLKVLSMNAGFEFPETIESVRV